MQPNDLERVARQIRRRDLQAVFEAGAGHIGGEMSAIDILATLYFGVLRVWPDQPRNPERDRFMLTKGHAACALYATLAHRGFMPEDELSHLPAAALPPERPPGPQQGAGRRDQHRPARPRPAGRRGRGPGRQAPRRAAGASSCSPATASCRRAATGRPSMAAAHYKLDNLTVIVDRNRLQQGAWTERDEGPRAAGRQVAGLRLGGPRGRRPRHRAIARYLRRRPRAPGNRPHCIIAHTHKGQGVSFMRGQGRGTTRCPAPSSTRSRWPNSRSWRHERGLTAPELLRLPRRLRRDAARARRATTQRIVAVCQRLRRLAASSAGSGKMSPSGWSTSASPSRTWSASAPGWPTAG